MTHELAMPKLQVSYRLEIRDEKGELVRVEIFDHEANRLEVQEDQHAA